MYVALCRHTYALYIRTIILLYSSTKHLRGKAIAILNHELFNQALLRDTRIGKFLLKP